MKAVHTISLAVLTILALGLSACCGGGASDSGSSDNKATEGGGDSPSGGGEAMADGFSKVPNSAGLMAKVPANAVPNGIGGAAGFHSDDKSFGFMVMEDSNPDGNMDQAKKDAEELFFKEWIKSEATADGWVLTYKTSKIDMSGDEPEEVGVNYSFEVRKKIGDKTYKCYGTVEKEEGLQPSVDACVSLKGS